MSKEIRLGLKDELKYAVHNYSSIRWTFDHMCRELKYAWQRAWRGYDSGNVFGFNDKFRDCMIVCLERLDETRQTLFTVPEEYEADFDDIKEEWGLRVFTDEQTSAILQTIIFHLKMSDDDYVEKQLYGKNIYDDDYDWNKTGEQYLKIEAVRKQNQDMAFDLLKIFWDQLWD